jgi:hypothetical protein
MNTNFKKINFIPRNKEIEKIVTPPKPAKLYIPDWYKKILKFENNNIEIKLDNKKNVKINTTIKSCMPFLDSLTIGYIQETWCDIYIKKENNKINYFYSMDPQIISHREKSNIESLEHYKTEFVWHQPYTIKLPKGYSCLYVHPLNRIDLPFFTLSGIIDNDLFFYESTENGSANIPFFIKKDFEGIIPAGSPMYQIIPFKRDDWKSIKNIFNNNQYSKARKYFYDGYKKMFWQKKIFI